MATEPRLIVMAGTEESDLTRLTEYEAIGGYRALQKARGLTPQAVIDEVIASELRGRGGAFFPTGRKWAFVPKPDQNPNPHYVVVNADESEPGSFKDNEIMARVPHRFFEGCLIAAHAIESKNVFVYIRGEYTGPQEVLLGALKELEARPDLRGDVTIVLHRGAIVAVQNGASPARIVRFVLNVAGDSIVAAQTIDENPVLAPEPTIGTMMGDRFVYVANSQWEEYDDAGHLKPGARLTRPRLVAVLLRRTSH